MVPVNEIHVTMAWRAEHHSVAWRRSGCSMAGRVIAEISLRLDDRAATRPVRRISNEPMAEDLQRDCFGRWMVKRFWQWGKRCPHAWLNAGCETPLLAAGTSERMAAIACFAVAANSSASMGG